jgi:hypothetical protein
MLQAGAARLGMFLFCASRHQGTAPVYVIDISEEQINIKIVLTVEKFLVIYDYSSPGHSNKEEVDKAWHAVSHRHQLEKM